MRKQAITPPATLGVLGGGQLGRMFALAARRMGFGVAVFCPEPNSPAGQVADRQWIASYEDLAALKQFAGQVAAVTIEFENIPASSLEFLRTLIPVKPSASVLHTTQHRLREKEFLRDHGFPLVSFERVNVGSDLKAVGKRLGYPFILKTAGFGYDGKGQFRIESEAAAETFQVTDDMVAEAFVSFLKEFSVIGARNVFGDYDDWGLIENVHRNHILHTSRLPGDFSPAQVKEAQEITRAVMEKLKVTGLLCVEFFLTEKGAVINELAPRPHNSGHLTIECSTTSQFEQQVRTLCDWPLGSTELLSAGAMVNLLGEVWSNSPPEWEAIDPSIKLHLYGKTDPKKGRKMGHLTGWGKTSSEALGKVCQAYLKVAQDRSS